jgi:hypothetical protein
MYDGDSLVQRLAEQGFVDIRQGEYRAGTVPLPLG